MPRYLLIPLAVTGGLAIAWMAYSWAVPEPSDLLPDRLSVTAPDARQKAFLDAAAANLDTPVLDGNRVELLVNGVEIFPEMLEAIEGAERSVNFLTYIYWTGEIARRMADALSDAAERGVDVRVLLDAYGASRMDDALVERMERAGVDVAWFHPIRWYHLRAMNNRTHRKILLVDGTIGFTGGVGIAEEWEGDADGPGEWRDDHFRIEGPVVAHLQGAFAENWRDATGEVLVGEALFPDLADRGAARAMPLSTSPRGDTSPIAFLYWLALRTAAEHVDISTPYFLPDASLLDELARAAERGVRVRLLVPGETNDSPLLRTASLVHYDELLEAGVEIYEFDVSMMHAKTVLIDHRWAIFGSANMDNRSLELNDEIALLVEDAGLVDRIGSSYEDDVRRSNRIELEGVRDRPTWKRLESRLALLLREQL